MAQEAGPISPPREFGFTREEIDAEIAWFNQVRADHDTIQFPRGDGYAVYAVDRTTTPYTLHHVEFMDRWTIEPALIRGLTDKEIDEHVEHARRLAEMFGGGK